MKYVLSLNAAAAEAMGANTRLRVLPKKRGGIDYVGLRPSYRVAGKNVMIQVSKAEDGTVTAELDVAAAEGLGLPAIEPGEYAFEPMSSTSYGWFVLKTPAEDAKADSPRITVAKSRKALVPPTDATAGASTETIATPGAGDNADTKAEAEGETAA